jgi:N-methylhydantoinase A
MVNGTTIVTNAITELKGARVGVLVTKGFKDIFRLLGGARKNVYDDQAQVNPPDIVSRDCIEEIEERVNSDGSALVPLDEDAVLEAIRRLRAKGVETLAVCFLWSFKNRTHEQRARRLIAKEWHEVFVSLSSDVHPVIREHQRFLTAVFNSFCQPSATVFIDTLEQRLTEEGLRGDLSYFSGEGGAISGDMAKRLPILLLASGPAGGVIGATHLARFLGHKNLMTADMGGTSFDVSLVENLSPMTRARVKIGPFETGMTAVDVISIGAGGGSIAWIDPRGVPQVGPESAGSNPGPVCYARGGSRPTVTDAAVVLGYIDPENYLGGRVKLDRSLATKAIDALFGKRFGWTPQEASEAIIDLVTTNMAHALREISIERGYDPRQFLMVAYGGMLPLFAVRICAKVGLEQIVVPRNSSVFSAFGVLTADYVRRYSRTVEWDLAEQVASKTVNAWREEMQSQALSDARHHGFQSSQCKTAWSGEFRFQGQTHEVAMPIPKRALTAKDAATLAGQFADIYERTYGKGTAWKWSPILMLNLVLSVSGSRPKPNLPKIARLTGRRAAAKASRRVFTASRSSEVEIPAYTEDQFVSNMAVSGPAIVDLSDSTLSIEPGWNCRRDDVGNFWMSIAKRASRNGKSAR